MIDDKRTPAEPRPEDATGERPSAGPHARKDLTNPDATPGAGSLPDENSAGDADGGTS